MSPRISIRLLGAQSDRRLAGLAGEGHERAFEALVQRYRRPLLRYCMRMRLSDARAEDVLQQAFLQAWMAFARGADVRDVRPWLYRIVHNVAVNAMRGNADGHGELTDAAQGRASLAGESDLQRAMDVHDALAGVAALPQMQQQAIFLTAVDGQSHDEVATVLGISEGAVRGLLYRARTTLRSAAAALTPPQLIEWAAGGGGAAAPSAERIAELSAGGGAAGLGGLLLKGAVVAVTAGAVATGATVASSDGQGTKSPAHRSHAFAPASAAVVADRAAGSGDAFAPVHSTRREHSRGHSEAGSRHGRGRGRGRGERSPNGDSHSGSSDDRSASAVLDDGSSGGQSSTSGSGGSGDKHSGSSGGSDGSGSQTGSASSGKGADGSVSGSSGGSSGRSGGGGAQSTSDTAAPVAQPPLTSGGVSDDAGATAGTISGGSGSSGSSSGSTSKGGSGADG
jgi:RNA polymerase sigma factor (sigma-70 family)